MDVCRHISLLIFGGNVRDEVYQIKSKKAIRGDSGLEFFFGSTRLSIFIAGNLER